MVSNIAGQAISNIATLRVNNPPVITKQPVSLTLNPGASATFDILASGTAPLNYRWFKDGSPLSDGGRISGATSNTLTLSGLVMADAGHYWCVASNMAGSATSNQARLTVNPTLSVSSAHGTPTPAVGDHVYTTGTLVNARIEGSPEVDTSGTTRLIATGWTGSGSVAASGVTTSTSFNIGLDSSITWLWKTQFTLTAAANPPLGGRVTLTDGVTSATGTWHDASTTVTLKAISNPGWVFANWSGDASGTATSTSLLMSQPLNVTANFTQIPVITLQPLSQTVNPGTPVDFVVAATGTAPLHYQWRKGGVPLSDGGTLSGATSATLHISAAAESDEGDYDCVVSNSGGQAISNIATLRVNNPPVITKQPVSLTLNPGASATFDILASGTAPLNYRWFKDGSPLSDGGRISGATSNTLTLSGLVLADAGHYWCVVSNMAGSATSNQARLTVNPTLSVSSAHGTPTPAVGDHAYTTGTLVNARIEGSPEVDTSGTTRLIATGWTGERFGGGQRRDHVDFIQYWFGFFDYLALEDAVHAYGRGQSAPGRAGNPDRWGDQRHGHLARCLHDRDAQSHLESRLGLRQLER